MVVKLIIYLFYFLYSLDKIIELNAFFYRNLLKKLNLLEKLERYDETIKLLNFKYFLFFCNSKYK